jgi:MFS transporter, DHA1 family, multidrug resistance protein
MRYANSALAVNILLRSTIGACFPMFASYMYDTLGIDWATSVLGFVTAVLIPVPVVFFIWGAKIRKLGTFSPVK